MGRLISKANITVLTLGLLITPYSQANDATLDLSYKGHIKYQTQLTHYPNDSFFINYTANPAWDNNFDFRHNLSFKKDAWSLQIDYQLLTKSGDSIESRAQLIGIGNLTPVIPSDQHRVMDLTHSIRSNNNTVIAHRLDRLYLNYNTEKNVFRIGRQAVSWGNGILYNPMDFFNPFDPSSIDKEYKTGDDLFYAQHLFDNGNDIQMLWVGRRNSASDIKQNVASTAIKYHHFINENELDLLLAQHFDDTTIAIGGTFNLAGAVIRGDIVASNIKTTNKTVISSVLNASYSWVLWDKNMSITAEYYHNGFGIDNADYGPAALANNSELIERLRRGELYTLAQDYLALSLTVELKPLWLVTPNLFWNLNDSSRFFQVISQHDLKQNLQFIAALNIPLGSDGTEFGGIDARAPNQTFSVDSTVFAQLSWYF